MIIDQQTWITHNYYIPWRHNWQRRRKIRERRETWRKRGAIPWSVPVSVIVCRWTMKKCRMSDYRAFFIRSSLRLHLSRRFTFVLCLAFHHPQSPAFQRLEDRASSNRLSIRLPRRKPNDNASRAGPDVIFKVISSHLIRPATCASRQLLGQGPKDRYASITSPWFCHSSRIHDPCYIFYRILHIWYFIDMIIVINGLWLWCIIETFFWKFFLLRYVEFVR